MKLLTKRETADFLRVSERTLDRLRQSKLIKSVKVRGGVRFEQKDVEKFLRQHRN